MLRTQIPTTLAEQIASGRTALLVYDMQVGIVSQIANGAEVVASVGRVLDAARTADLPIFFTRHLSLPKPLMGRFALRQAMAWQRTEDPEAVTPWFLRNMPGFEIVPELVPLPSEGVLDKLAMSAFEGTYLDFALRDLGIDAFLIVGIALEIGIVPTIRHGADRGYVPILVSDACGWGHDAAADRAFEDLRFLGDAILTDVESLLPLLAVG